LKNFSKKYHKPGTKPGTLNETVPPNFTIDLFDYTSASIKIYKDIEAPECMTFIKNDRCTWIHIQGHPSSDSMKSLSSYLDIHDLYLEDMMNLGQRPKVEVSDDHIFMILSLPQIINGKTNLEQISLYFTRNTLVSFSTGQTNPFDGVKARLKSSGTKLRRSAVDYLLYALVDTVIDYGFPLVEGYSENIESLENELLTVKNEKVLGSIHALRREVLLTRKRLWPQRDVVTEILRSDDCALLTENTLVHFRDCHDHVISIMEMLETCHEMTSGLMELYLTSVSLKLNDVMKFLTIFTTIFIPPTFIVGLYGMNFDSAAGPLNMPELNWQYGYLFVLLSIAGTITGMLWYFKRKGWI
jgi:magnesium transporter